MSWSELEQKILEQKRKNTIPLPFTIIEKINISSIDFDILSTVISEPNILYAHYSDSSVATSQGIWNCILINCLDDYRNILIYTAGTPTPLYASILNL